MTRHLAPRQRYRQLPHQPIIFVYPGVSMGPAAETNFALVDEPIIRGTLFADEIGVKECFD
jgi:hypothetical protein